MSKRLGAYANFGVGGVKGGSRDSLKIKSRSMGFLQRYACDGKLQGKKMILYILWVGLLPLLSGNWAGSPYSVFPSPLLHSHPQLPPHPPLHTVQIRNKHRPYWDVRCDVRSWKWMGISTQAIGNFQTRLEKRPQEATIKERDSRQELENKC